MIHVVATIHLKPGCLSQFLEIFKGNVPAVTAENGCIEYRPTVDVATGLAPQVLEPDTMVLIEKWSSIEALLNHLSTPHMLAYRAKVKEMVLKTSLKVLQDA
jgi:quinol monooxygenase YgiN